MKTAPANRSFACICLFLALVAFASAGHPEDFSKRLDVIAFGSCNRETHKQPYWNLIAEQEPDLWVWLGDNIYADTEDMAEMDRKYTIQLNNLNYLRFFKTHPVVGIWDDHDYGANDSDKTYPMRAESQEEFLDFIGEPRTSERRQTPGVYTSYTFGEGKQQVKLILLDTRYFADVKGEGEDILGEDQWAWLENELETSEARVNIIGSSIQVIPMDHRWEHWNRYPASREHLFSLIKEHKVPGVVIISGDRHLHELSMLHDETTRYPIYELTSSSLTSSVYRDREEPNRYRLGDLFPKNGFGLLHIGWDAHIPNIRMEIMDMDGIVQISNTVPLAFLEPHKDLDAE